eukprot:7372401-Pyramimonas_sp.AAC.1
MTMLAHSLKREGLVLADKSVIFSSGWNMTKRITSRLRKAGVDITPAGEARDLGIDRSSKGDTRRATHMARRKEACNRMNTLGRKPRILRRDKRFHMLNQGAMPALLHGVKARGEPPSAITQARRRYMSGIAKARPGRCTGAFLSLVGKGPSLEIPRAQLRAWSGLYARRPDLRKLISRSC